MLHVDDFIDDPWNDEKYAKWILHHFRLPATLQESFRVFMEDNHLFCNFEHRRYRVTGASQMGDIWLTDDFNQNIGYKIRVEIQECTNWGDKP